MKCTNFREEMNLIRQKELNELIVALEAHGGEYEFADGEEEDMDDLDNYPQVVCKIEDELMEFRVMKVAVDKDGHPYLLGKACGEYCGSDDVEEIDAKDVLVGDMSEIISMMDEPEQ